MSDKWINRVQLELKEIKDDNLPYFLDMNDVNYVPLEGKCEMSFMLSLDDDIAKEDGKIKLQRASSSRLIAIQADISIRVRPGTSIREASISYPYSEPKFILVSGEEFFPTSFNVSHGDRLKYENYCWNSNLYICDVIAGIATQIRRSIRSGNLSLVIEKESEDRPEKASLSSKKSTLMSKLNRLKELRGYLLKSREKDGSSSPEPDSKKEKKDRQLKKLRGIMRKTMVEENDLTISTEALDDSSEESFEVDEASNLNKDRDLRLVSSDTMANSIKEQLSLDVIAEEEDDMSNSSDSVSITAIAGSARQEISHKILLVSDTPESISEIEKRDDESSRRDVIPFQNLESERDESVTNEILSVDETKKMEDTNKNRQEGANDEINNNDFNVEAYETSSNSDPLAYDEDNDDCNYDIEDKENFIEETSLSDECHVSVKNEAMPIVPGIEKIEKSPQQVRSIDDKVKKNPHRELQRTPDTSNDRISYHATNDDLDVSKIINLSQHPYDKAYGHFRCKMIKRPSFMKDRLKKEVLETYLKTVQSRRNPIFQDEYIMIIDDKIVEIKRPNNHLLWANKAKIIACISMFSLRKIEYCLKKNTIQLFFKEGAKDPLEYKVDDSTAVSRMIDNAMKSLGIHGKYRTPDMEKARRTAVKICAQISLKQQKLFSQTELNHTSIELIQEIMKLYCTAAEKFEYGLDNRHNIVIQKMKVFLEDPRVARVLSSPNTNAISNDSTESTKMYSMSDCNSNFTSSTRGVLERSSSERTTCSHDSSAASSYNSDAENENQQHLHQKLLDMSRKPTQNLETMNRLPFQRRIVC